MAREENRDAALARVINKRIEIDDSKLATDSILVIDDESNEEMVATAAPRSLIPIAAPRRQPLMVQFAV
jgi:hypothetical protein